MELQRRGDGTTKRPPAPNAPTVTVLFGGEEGGPDVGVVRVAIPAGAGMPEHDHGGSDVVLVPQVGSVEISHGDETIVVGVGDAALIRKDERVSLRNPGEGEVEVLVAAGPPAFLTSIRAWPEPS
ncbi:MAG: cupin domain-containing protein [Actinomycetota bacterium]